MQNFKKNFRQNIVNMPQFRKEICLQKNTQAPLPRYVLVLLCCLMNNRCTTCDIQYEYGREPPH